MAAVLADNDAWLTKLSKLVPGEVTGLFLALRGVLMGQAPETYLNYHNEITTISFIVLGIYLIVSRVFGILHWIIVFASLILWIALIDASFVNDPNYSVVPWQLSSLLWLNKQLSSTTDIAIVTIAWLSILPLIPNDIINWYPRLPLTRLVNACWVRIRG